MFQHKASLSTTVRAIVVALLVSVAPAHASQPVVGTLDAIDDEGIVTGWALDRDAPSGSILVHFYLDGRPGSGQFAGSIDASIPRTDIPYPGSHGFRFAIPDRYLDGQSHLLYAYGIDTSGIGSENLELSSSPLTFTLDSTVVRLDNGFVQLGINPRCGGTLTEFRVLVGGPNPNLVNNYDCTGRQIQAAFYDGNQIYDACAGCGGVWGWGPVQGGDRYNFGSPVTDLSLDGDSIYVATRPYEWFPDGKGGGPGRPIQSDLLVEQWLSFTQASPYAIMLHYKITHLGTDTHANTVQEFPAVYLNLDYNQFVHYSGTRPWEGDSVTTESLGSLTPQRYVPERWAALVDGTGNGLTVYVPHQHPYVSGWSVSGTGGEYGFAANYLLPFSPFTFGPGAVMEGDIYLIAGPYWEGRQTVYELQAQDTGGLVDELPPFAVMDWPVTGQNMTGTVTVYGWGFDDTQVASMEVLVDGAPAGTATYGSSRPDVASVFPNASTEIGFAYSLDTRRYGNGSHVVEVRATDAAGNTALLPKAVVSMNNNTDTTAPTVSITTVSQRKLDLTVTISAADNVGVTRVELYIDGKLAGTDTSAPYSIRVSAKSYAFGTHQLTAKAYDAAGNTKVSQPVAWKRTR